MLPAGYLLKRVLPPPGWLATASSSMVEVCSVADCVNDNVVDVQGAWQHNSFGVANSPDVLAALVADAGADVSGAGLFYYTAYECEMESDGWTFNVADWRVRTPVRSATLPDQVRMPDPATATLIGYDIVVFGDFLEHSPLSCNSIADRVPVNAHCLLATLDEAVSAIENGAFGGGCEGGSYTIFGVHLMR